MARRSQFTHRTIGDDGISEIQLPLQIQSSGISPSPMSPIQQQLKQERLKNSKATRTLRIIYASVAVGFAIASIIFWMRFIQFYYDPTKHSDAFLPHSPLLAPLIFLLPLSQSSRDYFHLKKIIKI